jgi:hypothetical protein
MKIQSRVMFVVCMLFVLNNVLMAQASKDDRILSIRKYYQKVMKELKTYTKKEDEKIIKDEESNDLISYYKYEAYYNSQNKLVFLKTNSGDNAMLINNEYLFKDDKISFIFIKSGNNYKEERIYFWDNKIIEAYIKSTDQPNDLKNDISKLENKPHKEVLNNINEKTREYLLRVEDELKNMKGILKKK